MHKFEEYTLIVHITSGMYHADNPNHKFLAYLKEIPQDALCAFGGSQIFAIQNLKIAFNALQSEMTNKGILLPTPLPRT